MSDGLGQRTAMGLIFVVFTVGVFAAVVAVFNQAFSSAVPVTVRADRVGLLMDPGSLVLFRGAEIGTVQDVTTNGHSAEIHLALQRGAARELPDNVIASLSTTSLFGPKSVQLVLPAHPGPPGLAKGSVISANGADVEVNQLYQHLESLLTTLNPVQVNATLTAVSTALQGRGGQLGDLIGQLDHYLGQLNPSMPTLQHDISAGDSVLRTYNAATPNLLTALANLSVTSTTIDDKSTQLRDVLNKTTALGEITRRLLADNGNALTNTFHILSPTVSLLARYSPEFPCLFEGMNSNRQMLEKVVGGDRRSTRITLGFLPGAEPYRYPTDLSRVAAHGGPACRGLPSVGTQHAAPYVPTDTGTNPHAGTTAPQLGSPPVAVPLFGASETRSGAK